MNLLIIFPHVGRCRIRGSVFGERALLSKIRQPNFRILTELKFWEYLGAEFEPPTSFINSNIILYSLVIPIELLV